VPEERRLAAVPRHLRICAILRNRPRRSPALRTVRKVGLCCSLAAVMAFGLALIADNHNFGFGYHIARRDQLGLVTVAITLCALQAVLYRMARGKEGNAERYKRHKRS